MKKEHYRYNYISIGIECPPSIKKEVDSILTRHGIDRVEIFCSKSESEVMSIKELTPFMRKKIKDFMAQYDLKFGMTEQELKEYNDYEYFLRHPEEKLLVYEEDNDEEKEIVFERDLFAHLSSEKKEEMENVECFVIDDNGLPVSNREDKENSARNRLEELDRDLHFNYDPMSSVRPDDWEITLHSAAIRFMAQDPWFTKLFVSDEKRLTRAVRNAKKLYDLLRDEACHRSEDIISHRNKNNQERNELRLKYPNLFSHYRF